MSSVRTAANGGDGGGREFPFTDRHFDYVRTLVTDHAAIRLPDNKRQMVYGRLVRRLRELRLSSFDEYLQVLEDDNGGPEFVNLINAITTNLTSFFREKHHFELMRERYIPELIQRTGKRELKLWSAGCSTGEEPYSIAMTLLQGGFNAKLLATDIDTKVLDTAATGIYNADRINGLPGDITRRWFLRGKGDNADKVRVRPEVGKLITFRQLNLMQPWPMRGRFDIIFCRNVVIYFDKPTQAKLFNRYADQLEDGGYLFLGHSETMHNLSDRFKLLGNTVYQKVA